jgi:DNA polymerase II
MFEIHLHGYTEDGSYRHEVKYYKDYFYFDADTADILSRNTTFDVQEEIYTTYNGKKVKRVYYSSIDDKNNLAEDYLADMYESDVSPEFKYITKNEYKWSSFRHIIYYDIETSADPDDRDANSSDRADMPMTSLTMHSTATEKYYVITWHPDYEPDDDIDIQDRDNVRYIFCKNEKVMLEAFVDMFRKLKPDIFTGWYSNEYDMPYILNRCTILDVDYKKLSPSNKVSYYKSKGYWKIFVDGVDVIDMLEAIKDLKYNLPNYKLDTVAREVIGEDFGKETEFTWKDWKDNFAGFLKYAVRDVEILEKVDKELDIFGLYITMQALTNLERLGSVFYKSIVVDNYILKEFHEKMIFPSRMHHHKQNYKAAIVIEPTEPGLHKDVATVDYASLYPTCVMAFNISPDTFITSEAKLKLEGMDIDDAVEYMKDQNVEIIDTGHDEDLFGKRYLFKAQKEKLGFLPQILRDLYLERKKIQAKMHAEDDPVKKNKFHKHQQAIKLILNSSYGAMALNKFRLYLPECADTITYYARKALLYGIDSLETRYKFLYSDTDSMFIETGDDSIKELQDFLVDFNEKLNTDFVGTYNPDPDPKYLFMNLEYEKDLEYIYFGEKKKRYYGIIRDSDKKYIRGMNLIRKDAPKFIKTELTKIIELIIREKWGFEDLLAFREKIETIDLNEIGVTKAFTQPFHKYKVLAQHIKAAIWANDVLEDDDVFIDHTDNPFLFYVTSHCEDELKPKERHDAICILPEHISLLDKWSPLFTIDYEAFFDKQVLTPLDEFSLIPAVDEMLRAYKDRLPLKYRKVWSLKYTQLKREDDKLKPLPKKPKKVKEPKNDK